MLKCGAIPNYNVGTELNIVFRRETYNIVTRLRAGK